jgi:hypothetical protein
MTMRTRSLRILPALVMGATIFLAGCGGSSAPTAEEPVLPPVAETPSEEAIERQAPEVEQAELADESIPDGLDPEGVIAATMLIASGGDLEAAISAGLVTEAEAEAALTVLETGDASSILD